MRRTPAVLTFCALAVAAADAHAQTITIDSVTVRPRVLCPMPVHGTGTGGAVPMPTYRADPAVTYFMRVVPAQCENPLAPKSADATIAAADLDWSVPEEAARRRLLQLLVDSLSRRQKR